jgi:hypothetical protein
LPYGRSITRVQTDDFSPSQIGDSQDVGGQHRREDLRPAV